MIDPLEMTVAYLATRVGYLDNARAVKMNEFQKLMDELRKIEFDEVQGPTGSYIKLKEAIQEVPVGTSWSVDWDPVTKQWVRRRLA